MNNKIFFAILILCSQSLVSMDLSQKADKEKKSDTSEQNITKEYFQSVVYAYKIFKQAFNPKYSESFNIVACANCMHATKHLLITYKQKSGQKSQDWWHELTTASEEFKKLQNFQGPENKSCLDHTFKLFNESMSQEISLLDELLFCIRAGKFEDFVAHLHKCEMANVDINVLDNYGLSPLAYAILYDNLLMIRTLKVHGADCANLASRNINIFNISDKKETIDELKKYWNPDHFQCDDSQKESGLDHADVKHVSEIFSTILEKFENDLNSSSKTETTQKSEEFQARVSDFIDLRRSDVQKIPLTNDQPLIDLGFRVKGLYKAHLQALLVDSNELIAHALYDDVYCALLRVISWFSENSPVSISYETMMKKLDNFNLRFNDYILKLPDLINDLQPVLPIEYHEKSMADILSIIHSSVSKVSIEKEYSIYERLRDLIRIGSLADVERHILLLKIDRTHLDFPSVKRLTPLMQAVLYDHVDIVSLLLSYGANAHYTNENGVAALSLARSETMKKILSSTVSAGPAIEIMHLAQKIEREQKRAVLRKKVTRDANKQLEALRKKKKEDAKKLQDEQDKKKKSATSAEKQRRKSKKQRKHKVEPSSAPASVINESKENKDLPDLTPCPLGSECSNYVRKRYFAGIHAIELAQKALRKHPKIDLKSMVYQDDELLKQFVLSKHRHSAVLSWYVHHLKNSDACQDCCDINPKDMLKKIDDLAKFQNKSKHSKTECNE